MKRVKDSQMALIEELDETVRLWRDDSDLFSGGCAFAAYVLSDVLSRAGIEYSVTAYERAWLSRSSRIDPIGYMMTCAHLEIAVYGKDGRKIVFGGQWNGVGRCYAKRYRNIDPDTLHDYYYGLLENEDDSWNTTYDVSLNPLFVSQCMAVFDAWKADNAA